MIHLGSIGRTSIDVDLSFLIIMGLFVATFYQREMGLKYALLWAPVLFLSVLLHELAHAAAIGAFGYGASQIILGGMGGVTINKRRARPWQDMIISAAGPASSFVLAWLTVLVMINVPVARHDPMLIAFLPMMQKANVWWGVFNLIPVNPMDGGHIVRNFLRMFLKERAAFAVAVWIAIIVGAAIVALGIYIGFYLLALLIAWYVYINVQQWRQFRKGGFPGE